MWSQITLLAFKTFIDCGVKTTRNASETLMCARIEKEQENGLPHFFLALESPHVFANS